MVLMICEFQRIKDRITHELFPDFAPDSNTPSTESTNQESLNTLKILKVLHILLIVSLAFVVLVLIVLRAHYSIGKKPRVRLTSRHSDRSHVRLLRLQVHREEQQIPDS